MMEKIDRNFRRFAAEIRNELKKVKQSVDRVHRVGVVDSVDIASDTVSITDGPASVRVLDHWKPVVGDRVMWSMKGGDPFVVGAFGASHSGVIGGAGNSVTDASTSTVIGGETNAIYDNTKSAILGSTLATMRGTGAVNVMAGANNSTIGDPLAVGSWGGYRCFVQGQGNALAPTSGCSSVVQMSFQSSIDDADNSAVVGGWQNDLDGVGYSGIFCGRNNSMTTAEHGVVAGGQDNTIIGANYAFHGGGLRNDITGGWAAIIGSRDTSVSHNRAVMAGCDNRASVAANTLHCTQLHVFGASVSFAGLPTSSSGLATGQLWTSGSGSNKYVRMA